MNVLVKVPGEIKRKVIFVTTSPRVMCAKSMIRADVSQLDLLSMPDGLEVLERGVVAVHYELWLTHWWRAESLAEPDTSLRP